MFKTKLRTGIITLVAACSVVGASLAPAVAQAQPKQTTSAAGCLVEDEHGNTHLVPVGTRVGLFYCGNDGEWHFGWLVNGARVESKVPSTQTPVKPVALVGRTRKL